MAPALTLLPVRMAPSRLGIGCSTLKQWIYAGRVRTIETAGGHHRIPEAEIQRPSSEPPPERRSPQPPHGRTAIIVLGDSNRLCGRVEDVRSDGLVAQIGLCVGDHRLTAVIPAEALNDLRLRRGDDAVAIIKSTDVVIAKESFPTEKSRRHRRRKD